MISKNIHQDEVFQAVTTFLYKKQLNNISNTEMSRNLRKISQSNNGPNSYLQKTYKNIKKQQQKCENQKQLPSKKLTAKNLTEAI